MLLVGTLVDYGIQESVVFKVEVSACEANIVAFPAQTTLKSWAVMWGSPAYFYDISTTLETFSQ